MTAPSPPRNPRTSRPRRAGQRYRLPMFHPVPVAARSDGWSAQRQGDFIGWLAATGSVAEAARRVGMGRQSAYRLRARPGAAGFAAAWDAALGVVHRPVNLASAKATGLAAGYRYRAGLVKVRMRNGRFRASASIPDNNALLQYLAQLDRGLASRPPGWEYEGCG